MVLKMQTVAARTSSFLIAGVAIVLYAVFKGVLGDVKKPESILEK